MRRATFEHHSFDAEHLEITDLDPVEHHSPATRHAAGGVDL